MQQGLFYAVLGSRLPDVGSDKSLDPLDVVGIAGDAFLASLYEEVSGQDERLLFQAKYGV